MKKKLVMSIMSAIMVCASSMTAMAAPEIVEVNGVNEVFDAEYYAAVYPDVAAAFGTDKELLLQHYITFGQSEGRLSCAPETDLSQIIAAMQNEQPQISQTEQNLFEEQDFAALLSLEPALIATEDGTGKQANVTLLELLERAVIYEDHLAKYPNGFTAPAALQNYIEIASYAITGGYDKAAGIPHYYKGATDDVVDEPALYYYQLFADENPQSHLGQIVREYATLLQANQMKISGAVEAYYHTLPQKLMINR